MAPVKLILHFDINQTLILEDKAGGDSFEDALNLIVCKSAFVRIKGGGGTAQEAKEATSVDQLEWMNGHPIDGSAVDPNKVVCKGDADKIKEAIAAVDDGRGKFTIESVTA